MLILKVASNSEIIVYRGIDMLLRDDSHIVRIMLNINVDSFKDRGRSEETLNDNEKRGNW